MLFPRDAAETAAYGFLEKASLDFAHRKTDVPHEIVKRSWNEWMRNRTGIRVGAARREEPTPSKEFWIERLCAAMNNKKSKTEQSGVAGIQR